MASPGRVLPARRRILSGKLAVKGLPAAERRDAKAAGRSALMGEVRSAPFEADWVSQPPAGEHLLGAPRPGEA